MTEAVLELISKRLLDKARFHKNEAAKFESMGGQGALVVATAESSIARAMKEVADSIIDSIAETEAKEPKA